MSKTSIEWATDVWNPVAGCSIVSPGCHSCYAMRMAGRLEAMGQEKYRGTTEKRNGRTVWTGKLRPDADSLALPLSWRKPRTVFVNSMSDLFHESIPDAFVDQVVAAMTLCPQHTFQVLTKRPERMRRYFRTMEACYKGRTDDYMTRWAEPAVALSGSPCAAGFVEDCGWPMPNVWLGVSVEDQKRTDRIEDLLKTPAAVRFVSAEPLIEAVDFGLRNWAQIDRDDCRIDWLIVGGESGPGARPCNVDWIRSIVEDCRLAGVACFVKQVGANVEAANDRVAEWFDRCGHLTQDRTERLQGAVGRVRGFLDRKGGDPEEWPEDLQVREHPKGGGE